MNPSSIGIVFDCDGTLLDSMCVWREMETELARRADVTLTEDDKDVLTTLTIPECGAFFHERFGLGASGKDVEDMVDEFMLDFYRTRVEARAGALAFVQELASRGVRMTVASSSPQLYLQAGLERCGFAPYFDAIVSVDDVNASKREPLFGTARASSWARRVRSRGAWRIRCTPCTRSERRAIGRSASTTATFPARTKSSSNHAIMRFARSTSWRWKRSWLGTKLDSKLRCGRLAPGVFLVRGLRCGRSIAERS